MMEANELRNALGSFPTGVTVVTTFQGLSKSVGVTVSSFNALSLEPPLITWALSDTSRSINAFRKAERFAVHILGKPHEDLARTFTSKDSDRFSNVPYTVSANGTPDLGLGMARLDCQVAEKHVGGDHVLFVGKVEAVRFGTAQPLVFHRGKFAEFTSRDVTEEA